MRDRERGIPVPEEQMVQETYHDGTEKYRPSRMECLRNYEVKIRFLTIGCVISVGCKEIPFTSVKLAMECLNDYVERPYETCQIWEKRFQEEEE